MRQECTIPEGCQLDLWANVIVAKDVQCGEAILGGYNEYGEPEPYDLIVTGLEPDETVICIEDFKGEVTNYTTNIVCTSRVDVTIDFSGYFWVRTSEGYQCVGLDFTFSKQIPVSSFLKPDGTPLTADEFTSEVENVEVFVQNYSLAYVNVLPPDPYEPTQQVIQVIITADIISKVGKYRDVIVYGYVEEITC